MADDTMIPHLHNSSDADEEPEVSQNPQEGPGPVIVPHGVELPPPPLPDETEPDKIAETNEQGEKERDPADPDNLPGMTGQGMV